MSGPSTEYACVDQGISFDGPVMYCMVRVTNNFDMLVDGKRLYFGSGKYTGGTCSGGSGGGSTGGDPGTGGGDGGGGNNGGGNPGTGGGSGGDGPKPPNPDAPPLPPPPTSTPPGPDGACPPGKTKAANGQCYGPTPPPLNPDGDGACPPGYVRVATVCVAPSPPSGPGDTGGGSGGGGGGGDGDGDGEKSGFGGACASGFACEGDAIQCAIAREQHRRACQLFDDESPESKLYAQEIAKDRNRDVTKDLAGNETIDLSSRLSRENVLGGAACIRDLNIVVIGVAVTLPMSTICPALGYMGWVLVAVASLAAFRIVSGSKKDD